MRKIAIALITVFTCFIFVGCAGNETTSVDSDQATSTDTASFLTSASCTSCHDGLVDGDGNDCSFVTMWSGSVHAAASIDPYYLATVRHETLATSSLSEEIQDTCATCHLAMADITATATGASTAFLDNAATSESNLHELYVDGVSCTVCHQIDPESVADQASAASGNFLIALDSAEGKVLYGPYVLTDSMQAVMEGSIGYSAVQTDAMAESTFCATCHTLYTDAVDESGEATGATFPEQVPYLEWSQSTYADDGTTCQSCHMPSTTEDVAIATSSESKLGPITLHTFVGANTYLLSLVASQGSTAAEEGMAVTTENLEQKTATLAVSAARDKDTLQVAVDVASLVGHKFPTGFPSRRAWLHITVTDASGDIVFESGAWDAATGAIVGNDNDNDAATFEPHYDVIDSADEVQIYESIAADGDGAVTTVLMRAEGYLKDNRLLPVGFDKASADADSAVVGDALSDEDFIGGSDSVTYQVPLSNVTGDLTVTVELAYQSMGYRWLENLNDVATDEQETLALLTTENPNAPVIVTSATTQTD